MLSHRLRDGEVQMLKSNNHLNLCVKASSDLKISIIWVFSSQEKGWGEDISILPIPSQPSCLYTN